MKKAILISLAMLAAQAPLAAHADGRHGSATHLHGAARRRARSQRIQIWLTPDGRTYVIDSIVPARSGRHGLRTPAGNPNELICQAPLVAGFEVNAGGGDDQVRVAPEVADPGDDAGRRRATTSCRRRGPGQTERRRRATTS